MALCLRSGHYPRCHASPSSDRCPGPAPSSKTSSLGSQEGRGQGAAGWGGWGSWGPLLPLPPQPTWDASSKKLGAVDARVLAERASERARAGRGRGGDTEGPSGPLQGDPGAPSGRRVSGRVHERGPGRGRGAGPGRRQREATKGPERKGRQGEGLEGGAHGDPAPAACSLKVQVRAGSRVLWAEAGLGAPLSSKFSQENRD